MLFTVEIAEGVSSTTESAVTIAPVICCGASGVEDFLIFVIKWEEFLRTVCTRFANTAFGRLVVVEFVLPWGVVANTLGLFATEPVGEVTFPGFVADFAVTLTMTGVCRVDDDDGGGEEVVLVAAF